MNKYLQVVIYGIVGMAFIVAFIAGMSWVAHSYTDIFVVVLIPVTGVLSVIVLGMAIATIIGPWD